MIKFAAGIAAMILLAVSPELSLVFFVVAAVAVVIDVSEFAGVAVSKGNEQ